MDSENKMMVWIIGIICVCITIGCIFTTYLYHQKKIEMAKLGYEEVQVMKSAELGWQKAHK